MTLTEFQMAGIADALELLAPKTISLDQVLTIKNPNIFPIDPRSNKNPLKHIPFRSWFVSSTIPNNLNIPDEIEFDNTFVFNNTEMEKAQSTKLIHINENKRNRTKNSKLDNEPGIVKIYETYSNSYLFHKAYKEFIIIYHTKLIEYKYIYYNKKKEQVYIIMNYYGDNLMTKIKENGVMKKENELKIFMSDIIDKLWILQNCGYIHGDIKVFSSISM